MSALPRHRQRQQRGAISIIGLIWIGVAVVCLLSIDVGHVFWQKREVRKIADLAALSAAGSTESSCAAAGQASAVQNGLTSSDPAAVVECGNWEPQITDGSLRAVSAANGAPYNAARVTVTRNVPSLFASISGMDSRPITATATATARNLAAFSLGTGLARTANAGLTTQLLRALTGDASLALMDYQSGLASASINLQDLAARLNAGDTAALLNVDADAGLLRVMAEALGSNATASAMLNEVARVGIGPTTLKLGDLLSMSTANSPTVPNAQVNAFDLLMATVMAGAKGTTVQITLPGVTSAGLTVGEPAVLAVGEAGKGTDGQWKTQAKSAQVKLALTETLPLLTLEIGLQGARGEAWLTDAQCAVPSTASHVSIGAQSGIAALTAKLCLTSSSTCISAPISIVGTERQLDFVGEGGGTPQSTGSGASLSSSASSAVNSLTLNLASLGLPSAITQPVLNLLLNSLMPQIDTITQTTLDLLGVQLGYADVYYRSLTCGSAQLVY